MLQVGLAWALLLVSEYLRSGMRCGPGTGAPASIDTMDIFSEMRMELLIQRAVTGEFLDSRTLMEMGTLRAAQALRIDDKVGSLELVNVPTSLRSICPVHTLPPRQTLFLPFWAQWATAMFP